MNNIRISNKSTTRYLTVYVIACCIITRVTIKTQALIYRNHLWKVIFGSSVDSTYAHRVLSSVLIIYELSVVMSRARCLSPGDNLNSIAVNVELLRRIP